MCLKNFFPVLQSPFPKSSKFIKKSCHYSLPDNNLKLTLLSKQKYHCQTEFLKLATHCNLFCSLWILTLHFARRRGCGFLSEILFPSLQKECLLWSQTQKIWETCNRIEFQKPRTFFFLLYSLSRPPCIIIIIKVHKYTHNNA